jgi:hypothetical protein
MNADLQKLIAGCTAAAEHYCEKPDDAGVATVVDIYRTLAELATILATTQQRQPGERIH